MNVKTMNPISLHMSRRHEHGAALITGLIFLVVLSMIGVTAARMSTLEERMSGNLRDRSIAMQAAEITLRDAERDILHLGASARIRKFAISGITGFVADCDDDNTVDTQDDTDAADDDGLCYSGPTAWATVAWTSANWTTNMTGRPSVEYGTFTDAPPIAGLSDQPRYIIEGIRKTPPGGGEAFYYRITVRAEGMRDSTVVWLQEVFKPY